MREDRAVPGGDAELGWRVCALETCGQRFKVGADPDRPGFRAYCSDACALRSAAQRLGLTGVEARARADQAEAARLRAERAELMRARLPAMRRARAEAVARDPETTQAWEEHAVLRYGPRRAVVEELAVRPSGSRRVRLVCGHEATVTKGSREGRCKKCKVSLHPCPVTP